MEQAGASGSDLKHWCTRYEASKKTKAMRHERAGEGHDSEGEIDEVSQGYVHRIVTSLAVQEGETKLQEVYPRPSHATLDFPT